MPLDDVLGHVGCSRMKRARRVHAGMLFRSEGASSTPRGIWSDANTSRFLGVWGLCGRCLRVRQDRKGVRPLQSVAGHSGVWCRSGGGANQYTLNRANAGGESGRWEDGMKYFACIATAVGLLITQNA